MCLHFIQICIVGAITLKVFRTAECIEVSKYAVAFQLTWVAYAQVVGVGKHALYFLFYFVCRVGQVDTVAQ